MAKKERTGRRDTDPKVIKKIEKTSRKESAPPERFSLLGGLSDETRHSVIAILFFVIGVFFSVAPFGKAGLVGSSIYGGFDYLLGVGYFILPLLLFLLGVSFFRAARPNLAMTASVGAFLFLFSTLGLVNIFSGAGEGGLLGRLISYPLVKLFDTYVATLFLIAFLVISFLVMFNTQLNFGPLLFWRKKEDAEEEGETEVEIKGLPRETKEEVIEEEIKEPKQPKLAQVVAKIKDLPEKKMTPWEKECLSIK